MDADTYMRNQKKQLGRETEQIKDPSVFDFNYIPDQPLMREECKPLIDAMLRFDMIGMPTHMAVIGSRGSGKTLTLKFLQRLVPKQTNLSIVYANCRHHNTSFKILAHLLNIEARGASLAELFDRFCAQCQGRTVVILDEIDLMSIKDRRREILYLLSRAEKPFMVVMLSNSPAVLKELDAATRSSLQPRLTHFRNYNAQQIHEILRDRAKKGLAEWDGHAGCEGSGTAAEVHAKNVATLITKVGIELVGVGIQDESLRTVVADTIVVHEVNDLPAQLCKLLGRTLQKGMVRHVG